MFFQFELACFVVLTRYGLGARVFPIGDLPMKPLALKVVSIVGLVVVTLGGCTNAYGKEILNLELLCEGNVGVELNTLDKSKDYERLFLRLLLATAIENDTIEFSERLSIQENMLGKMPLQVTETLIVADLNEFPVDLREGLLSAVDEISKIPAANFSIDR